MTLANTFEELYPTLFSVAYRMTGSISQAEDIVQDSYLSWQKNPPEQVDSLKAFLIKVVTRRCIDFMRSARIQREEYIGNWLPEPLVAQTNQDPVHTLQLADSLSTAFLVLLENLNPIERAVYLLREIFNYDYEEISKIVDKTEENCRQIASRARKYIQDRRGRFDVSSPEHKLLTEQFLQSCATGDIQKLETLLANDVTLWSDGGGKVIAARKPVIGFEQVLRFFKNTIPKAPDNTFFQLTLINGKFGAIIYFDKVPVMTMGFDIKDQKIVDIYAVRNPDKLQHLKPLS